MLAIEAAAPGGPEALLAHERPTPTPGPGQVLVRVAAAGVNFIDTYRRSGHYPVDFPHRPGSEGAGEVSAVGDGVDLPLGARVAWTTSVTGSYAQEALIDADQALPVPDGMDLRTAAAAPLQGMTAVMLVDGVRTLRAGERIFVTAGAGGVGQLVLQLARARGATSVTTVSSAAKSALAQAAGADVVLRVDEMAQLTQELTQAVLAATDGGVDVAYDGVGRDTFEASLQILRRRGMLVLFGGASGPVPPVDPLVLMRRGSLFLTRPMLFDYIADRADLLPYWGQVTDAVAAGTLAIHVGEEYPLAQAAQAHRDLEARRTSGKVLLVPDP